jgi:hypothetical protein
MRKILVTLLIFLVHQTSLIAQCDNDVSTDYTNTPSNDALPSNSNAQDYLNTFNWVPRELNGNLKKYMTQGLNQGLLLPNDEINNIYSDQAGGWYSYIFNDIEPSSENGWELVGFNLGFYPNGTEQSSEFNDFPYILLYNKYSGVLRVFGLLGPGFGAFGTSIDAVVISLKFDESFNQNGMFRLSEGNDKSLDEETAITRMASIAKHPNANGRWFSSDFHMAYDPCVCFFESKIEFNFEFIEKQNVTAQINGISTEQNLVEGNFFNNEIDFLNNFAYSITGVDGVSESSNGYIIYKAMEFMVADYIRQLEEYEAKLDEVSAQSSEIKKNKWILKAFEYVLKTGLSYWTGPAILIKDALTQFAPSLLKPDGSVDPDELSKKAMKILSKEITTYVGDNFFDLEEKSLPEKPTMPMATYTQMKMQGEITRSTDIPGPRIFTPGSYGGVYENSSPELNGPHSYPVYNEALGHFALLENPKIILYQDRVNLDCVYNPIPETDFGEVTLMFDFLQQFKLEESLKYVINPVLDIKDYSIDVSIGVNTKTTRGDFEHFNLPLQDYALNNTELSANIESLIYDFYEEDKLAVYKDVWNSVTGLTTTKGSLDNLVIQTPFLPIDVINNITGSLGTHHEFLVDPFVGDETVGAYKCGIYTDPEAEYYDLKSYNHIFLDNKDFFLKIQLNIEYEDELNNGLIYIPNKKSYLFTYKIDPDNVTILNNPIDIAIVNSNYNIGQYSENLSLNGVNFDGSNVDGCELNGFTYTCKAWNDITLSGDFMVSNGYNVFVEAGNEIITVPESIIPTEMVRQIVPVLDYSNPMPPVDENFVNNFCKESGAYKARTSNMPLFNNDSTIVYEEDARDIFAFNIFPNPTSGSSTVSITLNESAKGELFITDMNGRTLATAFSNQTLRVGQTERQLPTASLASGIYLVHLFVDGERHVKRLVKQ